MFRTVLPGVTLVIGLVLGALLGASMSPKRSLSSAPDFSGADPAWSEVASSPDDPDAWLRLAELQHTRGALQRAELSLRSARQLDPSSGEIAGRLGFLLYESGRDKEAAELLREARKRGARLAMLDFTLATIDSTLDTSGPFPRFVSSEERARERGEASRRTDDREAAAQPERGDSPVDEDDDSSSAGDEADGDTERDNSEREDAERDDAVRDDTERGDTERDDTDRGDTERGDAERGDVDRDDESELDDARDDRAPGELDDDDDEVDSAPTPEEDREEPPPRRRGLTAFVIGDEPEPEMAVGPCDVPLRRRGRFGTFLVDIAVGDVEASLVFDTGANLTVISRAYAEAAGIRIDDFNPLIARTASGITQFSTAEIEELTVGGRTLERLRVAVCDHCSAPGMAGLLGLDAQARLGMTLDVERGVAVFGRCDQ